MLSHHTKAALAGAWILTAGLIGVMGNVTSIGAGAVILGFGLVPPLVLMLLHGTPVPVHNRRPLSPDTGSTR
jgi:membrane-bound ClpP family serine protease